MAIPRCLSQGSTAVLHAIILASVAVAVFGSYVCQVVTEEDASLQASLGMKCNISFGVCRCSASMINGVVWLLIDAGNFTLDAEPGKWYVMDQDATCVASFDGKTALSQPCPAGFYCKGNRQPPRSCHSGDHCPAGSADRQLCPFGSYCPLPSSPLFPCPAGAYCESGSTSPSACDAGNYCKDGLYNPCPLGHSCPYGTVDPRRCPVLARCPVGSQSPDITLYSLALAAFLFLSCFVGVRKYEQLKKRGGIGIVLVCAAILCFMWGIDIILAGYLTLIFVAVTFNWVLLRFATCSGTFRFYLAQLLIITTLGVGLGVLWILNPPWAMLVGGLACFVLLTWFMSRSNYVLVIVGRCLVLAAFVGLLFGYYRIDRDLAVWVGGFFLMTCVGIFLSFLWGRCCCQQTPRRPQWAFNLPFSSRWMGPAHLDSLLSTQAVISHAQSTLRPPSSQLRSASLVFSDSVRRDESVQNPTKQAVDMKAGRKGRSSSDDHEASPSPLLPSRLEGLTTSSTSSTATIAQGVSFWLEHVNFDLPDGNRLLEDVSLRIAPSRRVAVMGPSGSGKTTLLAVLSGRASYGRVSGSLSVSGQPADDLRFLLNVTGFVPQDDVLHGELTVQENILFQAALRLPDGTTDAELESCVKQVATDLNLTAILQSRVGTPERRGVSGGQRKRVSIAMELVSQPLLLFADEPTSGLDSTTSLDVVRSLKNAVARLGTTVVAVIHQPRYETLCLFDDLVLLGVGGCLVYAGETTSAVDYFQNRMKVKFLPCANPADILLDAIQPPLLSDKDLQSYVASWKAHRLQNSSAIDEMPTTLSRSELTRFSRLRVPFFRAVLFYMDRSMLQAIRAFPTILINQALCVLTVSILCHILPYTRLDQFMLQCTLASLFLMLLQGVAAQRIFGVDLLITWREARVGMPMTAYFVAKDLAALFEVTLSSAVFALCYGAMSGIQTGLPAVFGGSWAFVYAVYGSSYVFSIVLLPGAAQMSSVVVAFVAFCTSGIYQPQLPEMAAMFNGRGWMIPALSPVRWLYGYFLTQEARHVTELTLQGARDNLFGRGYDLQYLDDCYLSGVGVLDESILTLQQAWVQSRGWVCSVAQLLLLGVIFRFLAGMCLMLHVHAQTSGWARFFGQSDAGAWKLAGHLFKLLVACFLALFFFAELWVFGTIRFEFYSYMPATPRYSIVA